MKLNPYAFASNDWSQEDYDRRIVKSTVRGLESKGTRDEELEEVLPFLSSTRNAIDVGARFGSYTRSCHTAGFRHVYAFEVLERFMHDYSTNIDLTRATMWNCAILDRLGNYSLSGKRLTPRPGSTPTFTIDYFNFEEVDLIKIDIDSHDHLVLAGCYETIKRNRPIVQMEWGVLQRQVNPKTTEDEAWSSIKDLGYIKAGVSTNENLILVPYEILS